MHVQIALTNCRTRYTPNTDTTHVICHIFVVGVPQRFTAPVNVLEHLSVNMATPAMIVKLLPGHEGYSVALGNDVNHGNTGG